MNWYLAKIIFRIVCGNGDHKPQFDEQLRLIQAEDEKEAFMKAQLLGEQEKDVFVNMNRKLVEWQFVNVSELCKLTALIDGAELYSRIVEEDNAKMYIEMVNKRAAHIQQNSTHKFLQLL